MIYEVLFSLIGILIILLWIMIDKYRNQFKRANGWKADYIACKQTLDEKNKRFKTLQRYCKENCN